MPDYSNRKPWPPLAALARLYGLNPNPTFGLEPGGTYDRSLGHSMLTDEMKADQMNRHIQQQSQAAEAQQIEDYMRANQQPASPAQPLPTGQQPTRGVPLPRPRYGSYPPVILGVRG